METSFKPGDSDSLNNTVLDEDPTSLQELFTQHWDFLGTCKERPDVYNFRFLMWKAMHKFARSCQLSSKQMVPLFFRFLE